MARVVLTRTARAALAELDHPVAAAVVEALGRLEHEPEAGHALRGRLTGLRSLRVGAYRVIHQRHTDGTVRVVAIRHRAHAYRTDPR